MAFDQKLEADRIDDFNLFSAFVRVPLLIIGGILGVDQSKSTCEEIDVCTSANHHQDRNSKGDDIDIDIGIDSTTTRLYPRPQLSNISSNEFCMKRTKKMSWSDENGLPLVLYDESASHHHGSSPYASVTIPRIQKPTKSAIRSSRSIRQEADDLSSTRSQKSASTALSSSSLSSSRYIPTMKGKGLTLPTRPYGQSQPTDNQIAGNTNGSEMSPQWGWYINTTPPSPLSSTSTSERSSELDAATSKTIVDGNYRCQNQVFQNLKNSNAPVQGWTSIPI